MCQGRSKKGKGPHVETAVVWPDVTCSPLCLVQQAYELDRCRPPFQQQLLHLQCCVACVHDVFYLQNSAGLSKCSILSCGAWFSECAWGAYQQHVAA